MTAGRTCPLHYRYSPTVFARPAEIRAETIYVIGGLYGNEFAMQAIFELAAGEPVAPRLVFNGDFNWFNIDAQSFEAINRNVLKHIALRGNVETELVANGDTADCGCAYPDDVNDAEVARSNRIMQILQHTATGFPEIIAMLGALPMHAVAEVGGQRFGIVHGDAESLAGWRFAHNFLHEPENIVWLHRICNETDLTGFASSHTCLPAFRCLNDGVKRHVVINNGAAGMPNFSHTCYGLLSRLSIYPVREGLAQYGEAVGGVYVDALPIHYDGAQFQQRFLANWPLGSPAHRSYFARIVNGPDYAAPHALGLARASSVCA